MTVRVATYDDKDFEPPTPKRKTVVQRLEEALDENKALKAQLAARRTAVPPPASAAPVKPTQEELMRQYESLPTPQLKAKFRKYILGSTAK